MTDRYMTPGGKAKEMAFWEKSQRESVKPEGDTGGMGYVDREIVPFCDAINKIEYVCTLQSCAGHRREHPDKPGTTYFQPAQLWLWLRRNEAKKLYSKAAGLAGRDWVDSLKIQIIDGREIADIIFFPQELTPSMENNLLCFLRGLGPKS